MRKQTSRRGEDILYSFQHNIWTLYHTSYSIEKTGYPHKSHKVGLCPKYQKTKN